MSASSKPPRGWSTRPPTTERVARVLLDAETFGDRRAAEKAGIARRTLINWRQQWGSSDAVVAEMRRLRKALDDGWLDEGRRARRALIDRVVQLAAQNKNLTATTNALRRLNEVVLSNEIVHEPKEPPGGDQRHGADQPPDPGEAPRAGEGPGDPSDEDDLDGGQGGPLDVC